MRLDCLFISRKGRKGELRTITENYPTQNANPQTLAITGVSADWVITLPFWIKTPFLLEIRPKL